MLRFHARPGHVVYVPERRRSGQLYQYVGRHFVPGTDTSKAGEHKPTDEPYAIDELHADADVRKAARRLAAKCKEGGLLAADEATARFCGVAFEPSEKAEDGFVPKAKTDRKQPAKD